ncbi:hypothetical protein D3C78_1655620 [compost metagenome]
MKPDAEARYAIPFELCQVLTDRVEGVVMRHNADRLDHMSSFDAQVVLLSQPLHHPRVIDVAPVTRFTAIGGST